MRDIPRERCRAAYAPQSRSSTEISNERVRESTAPPRLGVRAWRNRAPGRLAQHAALSNQTGGIEVVPATVSRRPLQLSTAPPLGALGQGEAGAVPGHGPARIWLRDPSY